MIYDCFTFFNELDLLEIRLNILNEFVDRFILVEMSKTHTGKDKPFVFDENKERFSLFLNKIIHIKVDAIPLLNFSKKDYDGNNWFLENYQRDKIMEGLKDANDNDIVIISDLDEIPNPKVLKKYSSGIVRLEQNMYYYFLNYQNMTLPNWNHGSILGHFSDLKNPRQDLGDLVYCKYSNYGMPTYFRFCKGDIIKNGGWHFSFAMDIESMIIKRQSIVEQQFNTKKNMSYQYIKEKINSGEDIFGRNFEYKAVNIDDSFPEYIRNNQEKYSHLIFKITPEYIKLQKRKKLKLSIKNFLKNIFSITNDYENRHKILTITGVKIKWKKNKKVK